MTRFLHTSDWQLGMTRHFFSDGAQERYSQARFDAIRTTGRIASEEKCQFVLVCGDVFESNQVEGKKMRIKKHLNFTITLFMLLFNKKVSDEP